MSSSDSELKEDEEEILVYVEFDNCATNDVFSSEHLKLDMLGLDSEHPVMQVNGKFFEGTYEDAVGTYLFFDKDDNPVIDDPVFDKVPSLKYFEKTRKILKMQRAFVMPRYEVVGDSEHGRSVPNMETIKEAGVPPKYRKEALLFWENIRNKRMEARQEYLRKQEFRKELRMRGFEPESESDEDNPFAMYKYMENEADMAKYAENEDNDYDLQIENLENTLQMTELDKEEKAAAMKAPRKLTVIDPGPSTSKSSMPWIDDNDVPAEEKSMQQKVKCVGKVRDKITKGKVQKKIVRKKKISVSQKSMGKDFESDQCPRTPSDIGESCRRNSDKSASGKRLNSIENRLEQCSEKVTGSQSIKMEEMEIDEIAMEESERLLSEELGINDSFVTDKRKRKQEKREAKMREISEKLKAGQYPSQPNS